MASKYRLIAVSLLSTTMLTGCVVWQSDYDKLQSQISSFSSNLPPRNSRSAGCKGRSSTPSIATCYSRQEAGKCARKVSRSSST